MAYGSARRSHLMQLLAFLMAQPAEIYVEDGAEAVSLDIFAFHFPLPGCVGATLQYNQFCFKDGLFSPNCVRRAER
jgi:hypothetical protein